MKKLIAYIKRRIFIRRKLAELTDPTLLDRMLADD